jgi:hypothetical protein
LSQTNSEPEFNPNNLRIKHVVVATLPKRSAWLNGLKNSLAIEQITKKGKKKKK